MVVKRSLGNAASSAPILDIPCTKYLVQCTKSFWILHVCGKRMLILTLVQTPGGRAHHFKGMAYCDCSNLIQTVTLGGHESRVTLLHSCSCYQHVAKNREQFLAMDPGYSPTECAPV